MLESLQFMCSNFWVWCGSLIIITTIFGMIVAAIPKIIEVIVAAFQYTPTNMTKRAIWEVFSKDIKENDDYSAVEKIIQMYYILSILRQLRRCKNDIDDQKLIEKLAEMKHMMVMVEAMFKDDKDNVDIITTDSSSP